MGHDRKFHAKLRATAPLIRARSLRIQTLRRARSRGRESRVMRYDVAFALEQEEEEEARTPPPLRRRDGSLLSHRRRDATRRDETFPSLRERAVGA